MSLKDMIQEPDLAAMNEQLNNEHQQWNDGRERIRRQIQSDFKGYLKKYPGFGGSLIAQLIVDSELS
jgi:hypothetical protein